MRYLIVVAAVCALPSLVQAQEFYGAEVYSSPVPMSANYVVQEIDGMSVMYDGFVVSGAPNMVQPMPVSVAEPRWNPTVVASGIDRQSIQSMPILDRPYRPFHFYGNTVRRMHYRGRVAPSAGDVRSGIRALMFRR